MSGCRKVKLIKSYSHLHPTLVVGAIGNLGSSVGFDSNYRVYFPRAGRELNLFNNNFETILTPEEQEIFNQQIQTAYDVVHETGPQGGFQQLRFNYTKPKAGTERIYYRPEGMKILSLFKAQGTPVKVIKNSTR